MQFKELGNIANDIILNLFETTGEWNESKFVNKSNSSFYISIDFDYFDIYMETGCCLNKCHLTLHFMFWLLNVNFDIINVYNQNRSLWLRTRSKLFRWISRNLFKWTFICNLRCGNEHLDIFILRITHNLFRCSKLNATIVDIVWWHQ